MDPGDRVTGPQVKYDYMYSEGLKSKNSASESCTHTEGPLVCGGEALSAWYRVRVHVLQAGQFQEE